MLLAFEHVVPQLYGGYNRQIAGVVAMPKDKKPMQKAEVAAANETVAHTAASPVRVPEHYTGTSVEGLVDWAMARRKQADRDLANRLING